MSYKITKLPKSQIEILFEIPAEELEKFKKEAILHFGEHLKVQGFRPGKAPEEIVRREVGETAILEEASEISVKENYQKVISENNITPVSQPQVEILKMPAPYRTEGSGAGAYGNPFEFKVTVFVFPEVKLPDYRKIAGGVKKNEIKVDEKEIQDYLVWLQKSRAKFSLKNDAAQKGDFVDIEYGSPLLEEGKKHQDAFVLGEGHFLEGFESNLENMKDSQVKNFSVKFPDNYSQNDLAGKEVNFEVKMKSVQKMELSQINDEWARGLGNFENIEALKKNIKDGLIMEKEKAESDRIINEILEKTAAGADFDIPDALIDSEKNRILAELKDRIWQGLQIPFEEYLAKIKKSEKELLDSFSGQAQKRAKLNLVLREIAENEKIEATDGEIEEEINNFLKQYPDIKAAKSQFDGEKLRGYTEESIINGKTFKLLKSFIK